MIITPLACSQHNHTHCISDALSAARQVCAERGVRLTPLRQQVLELVWQSHKPLGAYLLMDMLAEIATRPIAPPTVYRALDFLLAQGLVHRINGLNAYVGCQAPSQEHQSHFLICRLCGVAVELDAGVLTLNIQLAGRKAGFSVESHSVEVMGTCPGCAQEHRKLTLTDSTHHE